MTLLELFKLLRKHIVLVVAVPVVLAVAVAAYCWTLMPNQYTANTSFYVLNTSGEDGQIVSADLTASQQLANDIAELAKSEMVAGRTAEQLGMGSLAGYEVAVSSSTTSRIINLSVTGPDPQTAADIANGLVEVSSTASQELMSVDSVRVSEQAMVPTASSGPNRVTYVAVAFLAGLFLAVAVVVVMDMVSTRVRTAQEAGELLDLPVIGYFPAMKA